MNDAAIALKREFILECIDLALTHLPWVSRHLQEERDEKAIVAFEKFAAAAREAAAELKTIRQHLADKKLSGGAAAEYRAQRDGRRAGGQAAA